MATGWTSSTDTSQRQDGKQYGARMGQDPRGFSGIAEELTSGSQLIFNNITSQQGQPVATRDHFMEVLGRWESYTPLNSLWMVVFNIPALVSEQRMRDWGERHIAHDWGIDAVRKRFDTHFYMKAMGCCLAQTVSVPVEQTSLDTVGPNNRGFLKGPIMGQRQSFAALNIEFLETTLSFVDFILRPWTIIAQHQGLVARQSTSGEKGYMGETSSLKRITSDIFLINFTRAGTKFQKNPGSSGEAYKNVRGLQVRKMWMFKDCLPVNIGNERYSYTSEGQVDRRETEWNFRKYQIMALPGFMEHMDATVGDPKNPTDRGPNHDHSIPRSTPSAKIPDSTVTEPGEGSGDAKVPDSKVTKPKDTPKAKIPDSKVNKPKKGTEGKVPDSKLTKPKKFDAEKIPDPKVTQPKKAPEAKISDSKVNKPGKGAGDAKVPDSKLTEPKKAPKPTIPESTLEPVEKGTRIPNPPSVLKPKNPAPAKIPESKLTQTNTNFGERVAAMPPSQLSQPKVPSPNIPQSTLKGRPVGIKQSIAESQMRSGNEHHAKYHQDIDFDRLV